MSDYEKAMWKGLEMIVMSAETWLAGTTTDADTAEDVVEQSTLPEEELAPEFLISFSSVSTSTGEVNKRKLKERFAAVVEDVYKLSCRA